MSNWTADKNICTPHPPYIVVFVVEVNDQSEGPSSHWLGRDEGVLKGGLFAGWNHGAELQSCEVLNVELVVLDHGRQTGLDWDWPHTYTFSKSVFELNNFLNQLVFSGGKKLRLSFSVCVLCVFWTTIPSTTLKWNSHLWITERSIQGLHNEVLCSFVGKAEQELNDVISWKVWRQTKTWVSGDCFFFLLLLQQIRN